MQREHPLWASGARILDNEFPGWQEEAKAAWMEKIRAAQRAQDAGDPMVIDGEVISAEVTEHGLILPHLCAIEGPLTAPEETIILVVLYTDGE
jgi:hypothetical protein